MRPTECRAHHVLHLDSHAVGCHHTASPCKGARWKLPPKALLLTDNRFQTAAADAVAVTAAYSALLDLLWVLGSPTGDASIGNTPRHWLPEHTATALGVEMILDLAMQGVLDRFKYQPEDHKRDDTLETCGAMQHLAWQGIYLAWIVIVQLWLAPQVVLCLCGESIGLSLALLWAAASHLSNKVRGWQ